MPNEPDTTEQLAAYFRWLESHLDERSTRVPFDVATTLEPDEALANNNDRYGDSTKLIAIDSHVDQRRRRRATLIRLCAAAAIVVVVVASLVLVRHRSGAVSPADDPTTMISVTYERSTFRQHAQLDCPGPEIRQPGTFDDFTIETWLDTTNRRYRTTVTYPDGTTRTLIGLGGYFFDQTELYISGKNRIAQLGCVGDGGSDDIVLVQAAAPTSIDQVYSLNPPNENLTPPDPTSSDPDVRYPPLAITADGQSFSNFRSTAQVLPGTSVDALGRPATVWEEGGGYSLSADGSQVGRRTTRFYVDPTTDQLLEYSVDEMVPGMGTATASTTLDSAAVIAVPASVFDHTGFERGRSWSERTSENTTTTEQPVGTTPATLD